MSFARAFRLSGLLFLLSVMQAQAQAGGDPGRGKTFALNACAECHVIDSVTQERANDGVPPFKAIANDNTKTEGALRIFLQAPHGQMPDFLLTRQEIEDVVAYIQTLRKP